MAFAYRMRRVNLDRIETVLAVVVIIGVLALLGRILLGDRGLDVNYMQGIAGVFLQAAVLSVYITSLSFAIGIGIGFLVGWLRSMRTVPVGHLVRDFRIAAKEESGSAATRNILFSLTLVWSGFKHAVRRIMDGYVELMRGTPLFVQIFFVWSVLLVYFTNIPQRDFIAVLVAMTINTGGYQGEIFRGGLQTVHSGQVEAARALGLSRWGAMRYVVLPQALRLITPPLTNEYIGLLKASSLAFYFGVRELTYYTKQEAFSGRNFEAFVLASVLYLAITFTLAKIVQRVETRYRIPGLGIQAALTRGVRRTRM